VIQRIVFERLQVGGHQVGQRRVTLRAVRHLVQQSPDGLEPRLLVQQAVMHGALVKQQGSGINDVLGVQIGQLSERLVVHPLPRQPAAIEQSQVIADQGRGLVIVQPILRGQDHALPGLRAEIQKLLCPRIGERDRRRQPIEKFWPGQRSLGLP
jgi:hypothetical protein